MPKVVEKVLLVILGIAMGALFARWTLCPDPEPPEYPRVIGELPKEIHALYATQFQEELCPENPPERSCPWPYYCQGLGGEPDRSAIDLLNEIEAWVRDEPITQARKDRIIAHCGRCRDPMLKNAQLEHVCDLQEPEPCMELKQEVYKAAQAAKNPEPPVPPEQKEGLWTIVENEFRQFPGGRAPN